MYINIKRKRKRKKERNTYIYIYIYIYIHIYIYMYSRKAPYILPDIVEMHGRLTKIVGMNGLEPRSYINKPHKAILVSGIQIDQESNTANNQIAHRIDHLRTYHNQQRRPSAAARLVGEK